jgi:hypothetical protein
MSSGKQILPAGRKRVPALMKTIPAQNLQLIDNLYIAKGQFMIHCFGGVFIAIYR